MEIVSWAPSAHVIIRKIIIAVNILHIIFIMWQEPLFYTPFSSFNACNIFTKKDLINIITFILKTNMVQRSEVFKSSRHGVWAPATPKHRGASHPLPCLSLSVLDQYSICGSSLLLMLLLIYQLVEKWVQNMYKMHCL